MTVRYDAGMSTVDGLLANNMLEGDAARAFEESRARVEARHANWRANFPAIGALLDSDVERAQALAGNYATEAREIVGVWLSAQEEAGSPPEVDDETRAAWVEEFWDAWRRRVMKGTDVAALEGAPRQRFVQIFDELRGRFRDEAASYVRGGGPHEPGGSSLIAKVTAPLRALARAIESFFFPSVG